MNENKITGFSFDRENLYFSVANETVVKILRIPINSLGKKINNATFTQLNNVCFIADGQGVRWPDLDEDISLEGLLSMQKRV